MLHHAETALKREQDLSDEPGYPSIDFVRKSKQWKMDIGVPARRSPASCLGFGASGRRLRSFLPVSERPQDLCYVLQFRLHQSGADGKILIDLACGLGQ